MAIQLLCECGQWYQTDDRNAGRRAKCPVCGRVLVVPAAEVVADRADDEVMVIEAAPSYTRPRGGGFWRWPTFFEFLLIVSIVGILIGLLMPAVSGQHEGFKRVQCVNNLKQIGLAMHNYHAAYGCLPPQAITDRRGRALLSWRVAILPYLDQVDLYNQFHLDEPWDSPANQALLERMPGIYACPSERGLPPGMTTYQAIVGPHTVFPGRSGDDSVVTFEKIRDGTANTILVAEARVAVPWTSPGDLPFDSSDSHFGLGSHHPGGFNAGFVDGSIRFLKNTIQSKTLRALLTRDGDEVVSEYDDPGF
jgi:prepilin-type processing-associated H-X9-DG protein